VWSGLAACLGRHPLHGEFGYDPRDTNSPETVGARPDDPAVVAHARRYHRMDNDGSVAVGDHIRSDRGRTGPLGRRAVNINRLDTPLRMQAHPGSRADTAESRAFVEFGPSVLD